MRRVLIVGAIIILLVLGILFFTPKNGSFSLFGPSASATVKNHTISLYIAKTTKEKEIGLSDKNDLPDNYGMVFLFDTPDYYSFWMKNMKFPIDIIFLKDNKIVTIDSNVPPPPSQFAQDNLPLYQPTEPADKVLEVGSGLADKYGLKKGDEITFKNIK